MSRPRSETLLEVAHHEEDLDGGDEKPIGAAEFHDRLQSLIRLYWSGIDQTETDSTVEGLQVLYRILGHEAGRVDGVARLFGIERDSALGVLRDALIAGKSCALASHRERHPDCSCEYSGDLEGELSFDA